MAKKPKLHIEVKLSENKINNWNNLLQELVNSGASFYLTDNGMSVYFYFGGDAGWALLLHPDGHWELS